MKRLDLTMGYVALVDDEDYEHLLKLPLKHNASPLKWAVHNVNKGRPYAVKRINDKLVFLHRLVWELHNSAIPKGKEIDHISGNTLDTRKENLRLVTRSQNCMNSRTRSDNSSGHRGVYRLTDQHRSRPWQAYINLDGKRKSLGVYATLEEAVKARKVAEDELFGDYSRK